MICLALDAPFKSLWDWASSRSRVCSWHLTNALDEPGFVARLDERGSMEVTKWKRRDERGSKRIAEPRALAIKQVLGADDQTRRATESAQIF